MQRTDERSLVAAIKPELRLLDTDELNAETPPHLLDDDVTPTRLLFTRNNGRLPSFDPDELAAWTLMVDGCVRTPRSFTLSQLRNDFPAVMQVAVMECAGNGRAYFAEQVEGALWQRGAVCCPQWTGLRLADLLAACEVLPDAVYTGHYSPDRDINGHPALSRGVPLAKALAPETMVAYALNGEPLPLIHGGPLRLLVPGYPASASQKWLMRIAIRDREHDGVRMGGLEYRMPRRPVRHGERVDPATFEVITDMPVRSLITHPRDGFSHSAGSPLTVRGHAWSGHVPVAKVEVSFDGGTSWRDASLAAARDRFAWRRFEAELADPPPGAIEIVARASDAQGHAQPLQSVAWNPRGYLNNIAHRIAGVVG